MIKYWIHHLNNRSTSTTCNTFRHSITSKGEIGFDGSTTFEGGGKNKHQNNVICNTENNNIYPSSLPPQFPSNTFTNILKSAAANTVYDILQQSNEYLHAKYETKPTDPPPQILFYVNHTTTAPPSSVPHTYQYLATNYLV